MSTLSINRQTKHAAIDWHEVAARLGDELRVTATDRDRARTRPTAEIAKLKAADLVNLLIPERFGGGGGSFSEAVDAVVEISRGDGSVGALLGFHYYAYSVPRFFDFEGEGGEILQKSAQNNWFWGNITQPQEPDFRVEALPDGRFLLNGRKRWSTGAALGDVTTVVGKRSDIRSLFYAVIPTDRKGLTFDHNWDHLGLNLAETVHSNFDSVEVLPHEVIHSTRGPQLSFAPFYVQAANTFYAAFIVGSTIGALERAAEYTRTKSRSFFSPSAATDPYILLQYGQAITRARAARVLLFDSAAAFDALWERRRDATPEELSDLWAAASAARSFAAEVGLEITANIHDLTGASSAANSEGLDRHWRDIRTLTLHDPLVYSARGLGDNFLNGQILAIPDFV